MNLLDLILNYYGVVLFILDVILIVNFALKHDWENRTLFEYVSIGVLTIIIMYNLINTQIIKEKTLIQQIPNTEEFYLIENVSRSGFLFFKTSEKSIVEYYDGKETKRIKVDIEDVNVLYDVKHQDENYVVCIYKKQKGLGDKYLDKIEFHLQQKGKE